MNRFDTEHEIVSPRTYFLTYLGLLVLLAATVAVAYLNLGFLAPFIALGIALVKAFLVIVNFMQARLSDTLTRVFIGAGFLWLAILIGLILADYLSRISGTSFNP